MKLNIMMTDANKPLQTIENVFNNALETKIEIHQEGKKISTTTMTTNIEKNTKEGPHASLYGSNKTTTYVYHTIHYNTL